MHDKRDDAIVIADISSSSLLSFLTKILRLMVSSRQYDEKHEIVTIKTSWSDIGTMPAPISEFSGVLK